MDGNVCKRQLIYLNVGGHSYTTSLSLLHLYKETTLSVLLSSAWHESNGKSPTDPLFIDRDGASFKYVLNFLRDGPSVVLPDKLCKLKQLFLEAQYFQVEILASIVQSCLNSQGVFFHNARWLPTTGCVVKFTLLALKDNGTDPNKAYLDFAYYLWMARNFSASFEDFGIRYARCDTCATNFHLKYCVTEEHNARVTMGQYCTVCGERERAISSLADLTEKALNLWKGRILERMQGKIMCVFNDTCVGVLWEFAKLYNGIKRPNHTVFFHVPIKDLENC